ncbi:helix-turn-helix domain-containing protein [Rhizobium hidalgonense]|uniref:helix-turn-helix domain-containing protein n=1 Tax=Rhizobium hidalgonense TaxID=1538159 RepID=UPI002870BA4F|nr:AraC family transcriptional regulator [Rhizobium hidalgonense]MDR9804204.1 AraC family transcriptional regulator [Rhizobium hidalgonense]
MLAIPLPFVIALLLVILLIRILAQREANLRPVAGFISVCILLVTLVGLRWSVDLRMVRFLQPVVAALLPSTAWLSFSKLGQSPSKRRWLHFFPAAVIVVLSATWERWHPPIDLLLPVLYFAYGTSLIHRSYGESNGFEWTRLSDVANARRAALSAGWLLLFSGAVDLVIAADFLLYQGSHAVSIVGIANVITLPFLAYAIAVLGWSVPQTQSSNQTWVDGQDEQPSNHETASAGQDDARIITAIETIMRDKHLFRDPDLTLNRLSRKLGIPSRQISGAVNRTLGRNISQVVNEYRIREAQHLLSETDRSITAVMFDCGFYTKSNFNREFVRVTGMTPSDHRRSAGRSNAGYSAGMALVKNPLTR